MKKTLLITLFLTAFLERVAFDLGPNVELVTMAMILSSFYIGRKESFWLVFAIMLLTDLVIGNTNIFLFTWTGFLIPAIFSYSLITFLRLKLRLKLIPLTLTGISTNLFFYFWTNFGVWLLSNMYPKTTTGLLTSYINALPFLRYQLISTLIFVPLGFVLTESIIAFDKKYKLKNRLTNFWGFTFKPAN